MKQWYTRDRPSDGNVPALPTKQTAHMVMESFNVPSYKRVEVWRFYRDLLDSIQFQKMHKLDLIYPL